MDETAVTFQPVATGAALQLVIRPRNECGCEACNDTGLAPSGQLDQDGLWFEDDKCVYCHGTGEARCSAIGCKRDATRVVRHADKVRERLCCDDVHCTLDIVNDYLRAEKAAND